MTLHYLTYNYKTILLLKFLFALLEYLVVLLEYWIVLLEYLIVLLEYLIVLLEYCNAFVLKQNHLTEIKIFQ